MTAFIETGHKKNLANLKQLIIFSIGYGTSYTPAKSSLTITELDALHKDGQDQLAEVLTKKNAFNDAINARQTAFADIRRKTTRIMSALRASGASPLKMNDALEYSRKIQGSRASKPKENPDPNAPVPKTISNSQQSYDLLIQHLEGLITVLSTEPSYNPNEADLKITNLQAYKADLLLKNNNLAAAYAAVSNARIQRDKILYTDSDSAYTRFYDAKAYIKSVFGATSPEYKQVSSLSFKKVLD